MTARLRHRKLDVFARSIGQTCSTCHYRTMLLPGEKDGEGCGFLEVTMPWWGYCHAWEAPRRPRTRRGAKRWTLRKRKA